MHCYWNPMTYSIRLTPFNYCQFFITPSELPTILLFTAWKRPIIVSFHHSYCFHDSCQTSLQRPLYACLSCALKCWYELQSKTDVVPNLYESLIIRLSISYFTVYEIESQHCWNVSSSIFLDSVTFFKDTQIFFDSCALPSVSRGISNNITVPRL